MPDGHSVPRGPFACFHATLAAVRAAQEADDRARDDLVVQIGLEIVRERVREFGAREHYETGGAQ